MRSRDPAHQPRPTHLALQRGVEVAAHGQQVPGSPLLEYPEVRLGLGQQPRADPLAAVLLIVSAEMRLKASRHLLDPLMAVPRFCSATPYSASLSSLGPRSVMSNTCVAARDSRL